MTAGRIASRESAHEKPSQSVLWLMSVVMSGLTSLVAFGQTAGTATMNSAEQGIPVRANANVTDTVSVEAVLLPKKICQRVFGKEIANNYAAIQLTVSNRSDQAALIVQSVFIDYSQWALSGASQAISTTQGNAVHSYQANTTHKPSSQHRISNRSWRATRCTTLDVAEHNPQGPTRSWLDCFGIRIYDRWGTRYP
jgi:hypothetical protein